MIYINFTPRKYVEKIYSSIILAKLIIFGLIIIIVIIGISALHYAKYKSLKIENENFVKEYKLLESQVLLSKKIEDDIKKIENYVLQIEKLNQNRYKYVAFMQDLVNNLPPTVWFLGIDTKTQSQIIDVKISVNSNSLEDLLWWFSFIDSNKKRYSDAKITSINYVPDYYMTQISYKYRYEI
ncbi:MAG: hypothetical protein N2Z20_04150 [Elusimicrobiales bacterium]|nr:hypothetical protein [Elusimicrobiales bacterium]